MRCGIIIESLVLSLLMLSCDGSESARKLSHDPKPRILITTDIGGDPDDIQSMIRVLATSNMMDLEGLIASASGTPGELDTFVVRPDIILELIDRYDSVYSNLKLHHPDYPEPTTLKGLVKKGNSMRGWDYVGEGNDTEASKWIERRILHNDARPLNICIWGGQTDLAQALSSLKKGRSADAFLKATENIRIYNINDQDRIHPMFEKEFPDLFHILASAPPGIDKREGAYRGMYLGGDESLTSREWVYSHVKKNHGPLGEFYPNQTWTAPNPHSCLKEGDTPSWFYFLNNGLQLPEKPEYGGWGGRFRLSMNHYYIDDMDRLDSVFDARVTTWRWRKDYQNDFEARMDWCVLSYDEANHHPQAVVNGNHSKKVLHIPLNGAKVIRLNAFGSSDPDGDELSYLWWIYPEPSGLETIPEIDDQTKPEIELNQDLLSGSNEIHLILEVTDNGKPALTSYRRIIITP